MLLLMVEYISHQTHCTISALLSKCHINKDTKKKKDIAKALHFAMTVSKNDTNFDCYSLFIVIFCTGGYKEFYILVQQACMCFMAGN